ncbi:MAG: hypothetical protein HGA80_01510 [Candidatus Omnitrophica bacterium]|nr:hypothetical protein [Candidatus Omnitrophota bacterium]
MNSRIFIVAEKLKEEYKDFNHKNKVNPLDELIFIICSIKRSESRYLLAFQDLKRAFPSHQSLSEASLSRIKRVLAPYGLQNEKALAIKELLRSIIKAFGKPTLSPLRKMGDRECEAFLLSLRGVGRKVARCVMMYSLGRAVFPVDSNCWRLCHRLGWIHWRHKVDVISSKDMDLLQAMMPEQLRASLHLNMVFHGRNVCTVRNPKCCICIIEKHCPRIFGHNVGTRQYKSG